MKTINAIRPIRNDNDLAVALERVDQLMGKTEAGTPQGDELEVLVTLIEYYESKHYAIASPDPIGLIRERMTNLGLTPSDLVPYVGSTGRVSEILSGKRRLSMRMIISLAPVLKVDPGSLLPKPA